MSRGKNMENNKQIILLLLLLNAKFYNYHRSQFKGRGGRCFWSDHQLQSPDDIISKP